MYVFPSIQIADYSLDIEDGVAGVHGSLVLGGLTDETLLVREAHEGGGGEGTLLVGDNLDIVALVGGHARVGGTCKQEIRSDINVSQVLLSSPAKVRPKGWRTRDGRRDRRRLAEQQ